jgi:hypothetical protein
MSDIFNEIDEEVRRDKVMSWWKGNILSIIIGVVVAVGGVAGYKFWQSQQLSAAQESTEQYYAALKALRTDKTNIAGLEAIIEKHPDSVGLLAKFNKAQVFSQAGETAKAVAVYDKIASSAKEAVFREAALIRSGYLTLDTATPSELQTKLGVLNKAGNAWRNSAREIMGMSFYRAGDVKKAHDLFNEILADRQASPGIFRRAQIMAELIGPKLK